MTKAEIGKKMFSLEENKVIIKKEPIEDYNQVYVKEEFSDESLIKNEPREEYNQIFIKEKYYNSEKVIKVEKDLSDANTVHIKTGFLTENQICFQEEFNLNLIDGKKFEIIQGKHNKRIFNKL